MANFDLTNLAVQMIAPNNKVIIDETELPSVMVYIPKFNLNEVMNTANTSVHPAFKVNGTEIPGFWCSKYQNCVHDGVAYSLPAQDPKCSINFDDSRARCEAKGNGWHLMTAVEWAAIALWCKKNGFMPYGNNNYGKDTRETTYRAIPSMPRDSSNRIQRVATGTGPVEWYHDKTLGGIADLNGNVWEWQGGIRIVWGELQILENNNAADPDNPQNATSECWKAINASTGELMTPESSISDNAPKQSGSSVKLDWKNSKWTYSNAVSNAAGGQGCSFANVTCDSNIGDAAKLVLRALAMLPDDGAVATDYQDDYFYMNNNQSERGVSRGGHWGNGAGAGLFDSNGLDGRANTNGYLGFRSAYIPEIG